MVAYVVGSEGRENKFLKEKKANLAIKLLQKIPNFTVFVAKNVGSIDQTGVSKKRYLRPKSIIIPIIGHCNGKIHSLALEVSKNVYIHPLS